MSTAAEIRKLVESALESRIPAALSFRPVQQAELLTCGVPELDAMLGGGLPLGGITEMTGAPGSGRTTIALSALAGITSGAIENTGEPSSPGWSCAYVDASDALDPVSAAALGIDLRRLLWVRAGEADAPHGSPFHAAPAHPAQPPERSGYGPGWCHPRNETVGLDRAIGELFQKPQTPRTDFTPRCSESLPRPHPELVKFTTRVNSASATMSSAPNTRAKRSSKNWTRLEQALRATDLLLSTGGFRAVVLDLGDVPPEQARRIPLATWYRFRLQVEKSRALFLLLTRIACANSCAALSVYCEPSSVRCERAADGSPALLTGLNYRVSVERNRRAPRPDDEFRMRLQSSPKKPSAWAQAHWHSTTAWTR